MSKNTYGSSHKREGQEPAKTNMMIASVIGPYSNNAYKSGISPKNKIEEQNKVQILIPSPNLPLHRLPIITRNWSQESLRTGKYKNIVKVANDSPPYPDEIYRGYHPLEPEQMQAPQRTLPVGQEDRIVYVDKQSLFTGDYQLKNMPRPNLKDFNPHVRKSSGRQQPNPLKETSSTTNTDNLSTYKSQKLFPSFVRSHNRSPPKFIDKGLNRDSFRLIRKIGEGKSGNVYLAQEVNTCVIVALKVLKKRKILEEGLLTQFIRELKIQTYCNHPNIIKNYGFFHDSENFFIIMELGCDGQLYDIIAKGKKFSEESTAFIIGHLLDAVSTLHASKVLHRDIKPENIVLVHGNVKLCDFGWAVNKKSQLRSTFCGTPLYLSPELLKGDKYDQKVDLWAIGILAYQLLVGTSPFNVNENSDLFKIVTEEIAFPAFVSKEFKYFIRAILRKDPRERLNCRQLLAMEFIKMYKEFDSCEELCY